ncbi:LamG domain-containing protein [Colwellia sp. RSH04]|nr:LamG domain-containing protein [Colwellia sp. RSH04]
MMLMNLLQRTCIHLGVIICLVFSTSSYSANCIDIFPGATNDGLLGNGFINVPPFTGANGYLSNPQNLLLGDQHYLANASSQTITVDSLPTSETTSRLYIAGGASWINAKINVSGNPEDLIIIVSGSLAIDGGNTEINAIIYSMGSVTITGKVDINGAIAAEGNISATPSADINYDSDAILNADFNGMCNNGVTPAIAILEYRFDECRYQGVSGEVVDSVGASNGIAVGGFTTDVNGQIEYSANIDDAQHYIETSVALPASYSVSTWFKKPTAANGNQYFVLGAMATGGDLLYLDGQNNWRWGVYDGAGSTNGTYEFGNLNSDWHHLTLVYSAGNTQLFIDGVFVDSVSRMPSGTLRYIGTSFDDIGSGSPQGFRAPLDEFIVFDNALSLTQIQEIFANQSVKNNYDGTTRTPVFCSPLVAEYKFEQPDFNTQIDDTSGYDNHADNILGGLSTPDGKYCRGFESESWNDYNGITDAFRAGPTINEVGVQGTISFWFNSSIDWDQGQERVLFDASKQSATDKYFVLEIQQNGRLKFAFEDSADADFTIIEGSNNRVKDTWYYVTTTWDFTNNSFAIYVDGVLRVQETRNTNGALGEFNRIVFGDNSSNYTQAGNSVIASPYSSRGDYDEVRIYNKVLTPTEIQTDMDDDNGCAKSIIAEWRMDELLWNGSAGEVLDEINALHGQALGGALTSNSDPARAGNPGTCGFGTFDGVNDYVQIADNDLLDLSEALSVSTWIYPESIPGSGLKSIVSKDTNYEFHLNPQGEIFWWWGDNSFSTSGANIAANNWYHVVITYRDGKQNIYINGVNRGSLSHAGTLPVNSNPLQIGQDQGISSRFFHGRIDEVRIYDYALSSTEVNDVYQATHPCDIYLDHFEIDTLDGEGLTCQADNITIRACADVDCNTLNIDNFTVDLLINGIPNKSINFSGGSVNTDYSYTVAGNAELSLAQGYECRNSNGTPCDVDFKTAGFIIDNALNDGIPTQLSGKSSDVEYNARNLFIQAVKTDDNSGACVGLFPDGGDVPINLSYTCHGDSSACTNALMLTNNGTSHAISTAVSAPSLRFNTDSKAFFDINYPDAGKLILNAQKTVQVSDADGNTEDLDLSVSSNAFVVRPFAFKLFFDENVDSDNAEALAEIVSGSRANGTKFKVAGDNFIITTTAVQWASGQDGNSDGYPDDLTSVSANTTALHFANEQVTLTGALQLPTPGNAGIFEQISDNFFIEANNSSVNNTLTYSEVGIITIDAELKNADYLGSGLGKIQGKIANVGRFYPAYFIQTVNNTGSLSANHDIDGTQLLCENKDWAYAGQTITQGGNTTGAISYAAADEPEIKITAYNINNVVTQNYTEAGFTKLAASGITILEPTMDDVKERKPIVPPVVDDRVRISSVMSAGSNPVVGDNNGELIYTFNSTDHFIYEHNNRSELAPFQARIPFIVDTIIDDDGVALYAGSAASITPKENVITEGVEIRFGRWLMQNSFAPETQDLPMPMFIQYFNGVEYINNPDESCMIPQIATKSISGTLGSGGLALWDYRLVDADNTDNLTPAHTDASVDGESFTVGVYRESGLSPALKFSAPPPSNRQGPLRVEYEVPPWLQFDWTGNDAFDDNPRATLTFGLYRGNDRIIYQREVDR